MNSFQINVLGIGSPLIDILAKVDDAFLAGVPGEKGGMQWVSSAEQAEIIGRLSSPVAKAVAGSASNTIYALARLGLPAGFCGMIGNDLNGAEYKEQMQSIDGDVSRILVHPTEPTGTCLALVTPDGARTMRTCLGAALSLSNDNLTPAVFDGITHVHLEGYTLYNLPLFRKILELAYDAECTVSLDLSSFEIVREHKTLLMSLIPEYINIIFANEDEAKAFSDNEESWEKGLEKLSALCQTVCVKLGAEGAVIASVDETVRIAAVPVAQVVDTTAAGDLWAAGFLYGYFQNHPLSECGKYGALLSAAGIQVLGTGASISEDDWADLMDKMA